MKWDVTGDMNRCLFQFHILGIMLDYHNNHQKPYEIDKILQSETDPAMNNSNPAPPTLPPNDQKWCSIQKWKKLKPKNKKIPIGVEVGEPEEWKNLKALGSRFDLDYSIQNQEQNRCERTWFIREERSIRNCFTFFDPGERREKLAKEGQRERSSSYSPESQKSILFQWDHRRHIYRVRRRGLSLCQKSDVPSHTL